MAEAARSPAEEMARLGVAERRELYALLGEAGCSALLADWAFWARPSQRAPGGDWRVWLLMAGRGFGKTRSGAEWVRGIAEAEPTARIALVGETLGDARQVMVEGESGLLAIAPSDRKPKFEPSRRRLTWPGGAQATLYSADEPNQLRGPQHSHAWCDELAKWTRGAESWANLDMGLRLGTNPRAMVTTTPRPTPLLKRLLGAAGTVVTRGSTFDNRSALPTSFVGRMIEDYGGTRLGRQELDGELVEDVPGALWTREMLERSRVVRAPELARIVVAVDPPVSAGPGADACGIVVAGLGADGRAYVIADRTVAGLRPEGWARAAVGAFAEFEADLMVAEANNGGLLVESVLRSVEAAVSLKLVHASRGKSARAEPVAALYEQGRVAHAGGFPELEDQLCGLVAGGGYEGPGRSPDRADALVWAVTELMLARRGRPALKRL